MPLQAIRVTVYINEADKWKDKPLYLEVLRMLHEQGLAGATVLQAIAGFTGRGGTQTSNAPDAAGKPPLVIQFVDTAAHVAQAMPVLREMVGNRLIVRDTVELEI
jgi:hypothetical protein